MANISGQVIFDRDRSASFSSGDSGIANILSLIHIFQHL